MSLRAGHTECLIVKYQVKGKSIIFNLRRFQANSCRLLQGKIKYVKWIYLKFYNVNLEKVLHIGIYNLF